MSDYKLTVISRVRKNSGFTLIEVLITILVVSIGLLGLAGLQISGLRANMGSETRSKATILANDIVERMRANRLGVEANLYSNISTANYAGSGGQPCTANTPAKICSNYNDSAVTTEYTQDDGTVVSVTAQSDGTATTVTTDTTAPDGTFTTSTVTDNSASTATAADECTPAEMAAFDAWVWSCGLPVANKVKRGGITNQLFNGTASVTCNDSPCKVGSTHTVTVNWDALNPDRSGNVPQTLTQTYSLVVVP